MKTDDKKKPDIRPLDPTRSGGDSIGDTTGMTGITTGSAKGVSATPDDVQKDQNKAHLPGSIASEEGETDNIGQVPKESVSDEIYRKHVRAGMSDVKGDASEDLANEAEITGTASSNAPSAVTASQANNDAKGVNIQNASGDDSPGSEDINTETAPYQQPENLGGQSVSGSNPDPTSDDDTQANAHGVGEQLGESENEENPQEIDIGRDVDEAEEYLRNH